MIQWFFLTPIGRWITLALGVLTALILVIRRQERDRFIINEGKKEERGREAVAREKKSTRWATHGDLVDRLRRRDGRWSGM